MKKVKLIRDIDSNESHRIWKRIQDRCGVTTGDVPPDVHFSITGKMEDKGMTVKQLEKDILSFYRAYGYICQKKGKSKPQYPNVWND